MSEWFLFVLVGFFLGVWLLGLMVAPSLAGLFC